MKISMVQISSPIEERPAQRIERAFDKISSLEPTDLVILPELWAVGYFNFDEYHDCAQHLDRSRIVERLSQKARQSQCWIHGGSIVESDARGQIYNTSILIGPNGAVEFSYRKIHVFGYQSLESRIVSPGNSVETVTSQFGRLSGVICYDLRFPELWRSLTDMGAEIVVIPAAWPMERLAHWQTLTTSRAIENQIYVLACNASGMQGSVQLAGHSRVVDPFGEVIAELGAGEDVLTIDIEPDLVRSARVRFPVLDDRRWPARQPTKERALMKYDKQR